MKLINDQLEKDIVWALLGAEKKTLDHASYIAFKYSGGKYKARKLAQLGHPYAVRNIGRMRTTKSGRTVSSVPYGDPAFINSQSGEFFRHWLRHNPRVAGSIIVSQLTNTSPYADDLAKGIPGLTMPRPLMDRVITTVEFWRIRNLTIGVRNAIEGKQFLYY